MNLRFVTHTSSTNTIWGVPTRFVPLALDTSDSPKKAIICTPVGVHLGSLDLVAHRIDPLALGGVGADEELAEIGVEILLAELRIVLPPLLRRSGELLSEIARLEFGNAA